MSTAIVSTNGINAEHEFQAKMQERMRQAMGDLMPDEVLKGIVSKGIEEAFFKPVETKKDYGRVEVEQPWTVRFLKAELESRVEKSVRAWIAANHEKLSDILKETLDAGLSRAVLRAFDREWANSFMALQGDMNMRFDKIRRGEQP